MIHGLETEEKENAATLLGSTLVADLTMEGAPVQDLIDMGSLVTVASLDFLLETWLKHRPAEQSLEDWKSHVRDQLQQFQISIQNYRGEKSNIILSGCRNHC